MTLGDLFLQIGDTIKKYENSCLITEVQNEKEKLYGIEEIISIFPQLSKHIITKAINNNEIHATWIGNKRYFSISEINKLLKCEKPTNNNESWRNI